MARLAQVGLSTFESFADMIGWPYLIASIPHSILTYYSLAFQGASGFAAARVVYNLAPAAFVDPSGYTIETFEVPLRLCTGTGIVLTPLNSSHQERRMVLRMPTYTLYAAKRRANTLHR